MSNYIGQNKVNMAHEPLKFEQPLLENSSEIDKLVNDQNETFPRHPKYSVGDQLS